MMLTFLSSSLKLSPRSNHHWHIKAINISNKYHSSRRLLISEENRFMVIGNLADGIHVGSYCEVVHTFPQSDVNTFSGLCGDNNPIHVDPVIAADSMFKGTIVHGIFLSSLFSTLFGRSISGSIYVSQSLKFKRPVHVGAKVRARMEILSITDMRKGRLMKCSTQIFLMDSDKLAVDGEAEVLLPITS